MPVDISGFRALKICRSGVSASDTIAPTGNGGTLQGASTAVEVPANSAGGITHVLVFLDGSASSAQAIVTILGLPDESSGLSDSDPSNLFAGKWFALWQLTGGSAVTSSTRNAIAPAGNDVLYAESLGHITAYRKLTATITSLSNATAYVAFVFETP